MLRTVLAPIGRSLSVSLSGVGQKYPTRSYSSGALATGYKPADVELRQDVLQTTPALPNAPKYSFILPPPNVTGDLHLGHALMCTVQDVIARHRRRHGHDVCWIPGTDHAGIATQVVVEKHLRKQQGLGRHQIGRDRFLAEVWRWRDGKALGIRDDLRRLGATADWEREFFTMDDGQSRAVREAFVRLFDEGLIYREGQLVNWSCALESTISDIEVDTVQVQGPTPIVVPGYEKPIVFGEITELAYAVCDADDNPSDEFVNVATTRPETMLGDVAVAVHPDDERFAHLRASGRQPMLWHALRRQRIPLVFDAAVDRAFGTGAVKITPAHDRFDYELARRHELPTTLAVINERGTICEGFDAAGALSGMRRFDARTHIKDQLANLGLLRAIRPHTMQLPVCSRSKDIVELLLRPQWFVRCGEMAAEARRCVETGELRIQPEQFESEWHRWLAESRDWCVSRQLWWGHRIPAYECRTADGTQTVWVAAADEAEARTKAAAELTGHDGESLRIAQDKDVLDTWFSSALLPFSAVGWPAAANSTDYTHYYPHDLLVTGHDILFFWVARMVMLGKRLTGQVPFGTVLLHGIVCDAQGRKMSKSLGNVVTPGQVIGGASLAALQADTDTAYEAGVLTAAECERSKRDQAKLFPNGIAECGTDALRLTLCSHNIKSHFVAFDANECYTNKLFLNKIWQATRFTVAARQKWSIGEAFAPEAARLSRMDRWILSRLARTVTTIDAAMEQFQFHVATAALKTFFYQNLCDVYLETTKTGLAADDAVRARDLCAVLSMCLGRGFEELASFAPFVCQELQQHITAEWQFTAAEWIDEKLEQDVEEMMQICAAIRQLKSEHNITRKHQPKVFIHISDAILLQNLRLHHSEDIRVLSLCASIQLNDLPLSTLQTVDNAKLIAQSTAGAHCTFGIQISDEAGRQLRNTDTAVLSVNERKQQKLEQDLQRLERTVEAEGYRRSASAKVKQQHTEKIDRIRSELASIRQMG